jgi:hypothetical protein
MATIASVDTKSTSEVAISPTTLGASDTFVYQRGVTKYLVIDNVTEGAITPNIDGDGADTAYLSGVGSVDISGGYTFGSIAAGDAVVIDLDAISAYLQGTIEVTGGDDAEAYILEV